MLELTRPLAEAPRGDNAIVPTVQAILAMTLWYQGETEEARVVLDRARDAVGGHFAEPMKVGDTRRGLW